MYLPCRLTIYELLNRTNSRIVRVVAASGRAQDFRIVLQAKVKIKDSTSSVYSRLVYGKLTLSCESTGISEYPDFVLHHSSSYFFLILDNKDSKYRGFI